MSTNKRDHRHPLDIERTLDEMREIRLASGLTQEQLADKVGVPRTYISKWESREIVPSFDHLVILHRILCGLRMESEVAHG